MTALNSGAQPPRDPVHFLKAVQPEGSLVTVISQDRTKVITRRFVPGEEQLLRAFIGDCNSPAHMFNVYWHVATPKDGVKCRLNKELVASSRYVWVDIDPRVGEPIDEEKTRLIALITTNRPKEVPPPTWSYFSGGGVQAVWELTEPCEDLNKIERANKHLSYLFGGDGCHSIEHLMRVGVGTMNWPDEKKKKRNPGRTNAMTHMVEQHDVKYPIDSFTLAPEEQAPMLSTAAKVTLGKVEQVNSLETLNVPDDIKIIIAQGHHPDKPKGEGKDGSGSGWVWHAVCGLVRAAVPAETIVSILTDAAWPISEHVLRQKNPVKYAVRQVERAMTATRDFVRAKSGQPFTNFPGNVLIAIEMLGIELTYDAFQDRALIAGLEGEGPKLDDHALRRLRMLIAERFQFMPDKDMFTDVVLDLARQHTFHPVLDYLDGLKWDGVKRIDRWLIDYGGAEDTPFNRAAGALWSVAAVRRVQSPGCKFDELPVGEADQGTNKSSALRILAVKDEWFSDYFPLGKDGKEVIEATQGKWIIEAAELHGMSTAKIEQLKAQLSRQVDSARLAYGRLPTDVPRQFVAFSTTNSNRYLTDPTGNRRFWPVKVQRFDLEALRRDRDQFWAEAAAREAEGVSLHLPEELWPVAAVVQAARVEDHPFVAQFEAMLGDLDNCRFICAEAWDLLGLQPGHMTQANQVNIGNSLRSLGWERKRLRVYGKNQWCYVKGDGERLISAHEILRPKDVPF
jgi:predicted P-loop ATPase